MTRQYPGQAVIQLFRTRLFLFVTWLILANIPFAQAEQTGASTTPGVFLGAMETTHPDWFKESFLDFEEDIDEAAAEGKRLILYFHQDGCPYCNKLVDDNFKNELIKEKVQAQFDLVAINMWGDREVIQVGGRSFTEKTLAAALNISFTPTLLFFSEDKQVALRIDGYYPPEDMLHALAYVSGKKEKTLSYNAYLETVQEKKLDGEMNQADWLSPLPYHLDQWTDKPIAVLFEEANCDFCDQLHQKTFTNEAAPELLEKFHIIQVNRHAPTPITLHDGTKTTAKDWANELNLGFSPSILFLDTEGNEVMKVDAMFKTFHILGVFDYVSSGAYLTEPSFQRFLSEKAEHIISTGKDVNIWSY